MNALRRKDGWEERLGDIVEEWRHAPFKWGVYDCATWGNAVVLALTGVNHVSLFHGAYDGALSAVRLEEKVGGMATVLQQVGLRKVRVSFAHRGDLVLFEGGLGRTIGAVIGSHVAAPGKEGLVFISREDIAQLAESAWRVEYA